MLKLGPPYFNTLVREVDYEEMCINSSPSPRGSSLGECGSHLVLPSPAREDFEFHFSGRHPPGRGDFDDKKRGVSLPGEAGERGRLPVS